MLTAAPDAPYLRDNYAPVTEEHDHLALTCTFGQVPRDLAGALERAFGPSGDFRREQRRGLRIRRPGRNGDACSRHPGKVGKLGGLSERRGHQEKEGHDHIRILAFARRKRPPPYLRANSPQG